MRSNANRPFSIISGHTLWPSVRERRRKMRSNANRPFTITPGHTFWPSVKILVR